MFKEKTSIVFINTTDHETKSIQVPTIILRQWKSYFFIISLIAVLIVYLLVAALNEKVNIGYTQDQNIEKSKNAEGMIVGSIDMKKIEQNFESIDKSISRINFFMKQRGLESFKLKDQEKNKKFQITELDKMSSDYLQHTLEVEKFLENTPLGKPYDGVQTSGFGHRENPFGDSSRENHKGIDFRGEMGAPVKSAASGKVIFAGRKGGYGNCVIIQHIKGFETLYGHLSKINVKDGQIVKVGTIIGELGSTGRSTGPHLHYEIILNGEKIDPQNYLNL